MKRRIMLALRVALVVAALWVLYHELSTLSGPALVAQLRSFGWAHVLLGAAATIGSFALLGAIEIMAVRYASLEASRVKTGVAFGTGVIASALGQSIGLSVLTGSAIRARAYDRFRLDAPAIARITAFVTITATLGLLAAGAVALVAAPSHIAAGRLAVTTLPVGIALGIAVLAYLVWAAFGSKASVGFGRWTLTRPTFPIAAGQVALSVVDWLLAGTVLFAFLPGSLGLGYFSALGAYMIAQTLAVTSHVPAGAGVFEIAIIGLLARGTPETARAGVVAALVMFRVFYYIAPLVLALIAAGVAELRRRRVSRGGREVRLNDVVVPSVN